MSIVQTVDGYWLDEDDAVHCIDCGDWYGDIHELDDHMRCPDCAADAAELDRELGELCADWAADRGCGKSPKGGW